MARDGVWAGSPTAGAPVWSGMVIVPRSCSSAASTSSFHVIAERSSIRSRGQRGWGRIVLKPTPRRKSAGMRQPGSVPGCCSPNTSIALTPRRVRSLTTACASIRPSPSPENSGITCMVVSNTASALTGPVGISAARGTAEGGA